MKLTLRAVLFLLLCHSMGVSPAYAQDVTALFLDRGRIVYESEPREKEYRLALSSLKKVNNQWRVSREEKITGVVQRKTVELSNTATFAEARRQLREALTGVQGATVAFTCEGLDCGSSSGWANHVFNVKILYGLDSYQYYTVLRTERGDQTVYAVYYLVQRGSGRIYLQQDIVKSQSAEADVAPVTEASIKKHLMSHGYWTIPGEERSLQSMDAAEVEHVKTLMTENRHWQLAIVGHNYQSVSLDEQRARSLLHAKVIEQQLLDAGVSAAQMNSYGLGSLAPAGRVGLARVELVLLNP